MHIKSHPNSHLLLTINTRRNPINPPNHHTQRMEKLKQTVLNLASSNLNNPPLTPSQISAIEKRLFDTFSSLKTPTHPTYSSMILDAIKVLNEEGRLTTEEIISEKIVKTNEGLPWAHKRYLEHHLCKLCESGELIYDSDGSYNFPDIRRQKRSRKLLRQRGVSAVKDDVVEDEMQELNDSHVGFQEDASEELGRGKRKRKRKRSFIFDDEDEEEEGVETRVVVKEGNVETRNEVLLLESGEGECRSGDCVDFTAGKVESKLDVEHLKEVNNRVNHEISEGGKGLENVVTVAQGEVMKSDDGNCDLLVAPLVSVSDIEMIDAAGNAVEKSVLKGTKPNPCDNELMIVPYVGNSENSAVGKEIIPLLESKGAVIVCGLSCEKPETPKKKLLVYLQRRRRSKSTPEKAKAFDSSGQRSLETKLKRKSQSPKSKEVTLLEDGSAKLLEKLESTHPSHLGSISMEDEETLTQVFQKCGHRKKHGMQGGMFKDASALASSKAGNQLPKEPPSLETSVDLAPTVEKESASTKGTEKQFHMQVSMLDKSCDDVEEDVIRKPSSSFSMEAGTKSLDGRDYQQPIISNSSTSCQPDFVNVKHQEKQTQLSCDSQCALDGGSQSIVEGPEVQCLEEPSKPKETTDGFITPSLLVELHQQEVGPSEPAGSQSIVEGPEVQCLEESSKPKETTDGLITPSLLVELHQQQVGSFEPTGSQNIIEGPKVQCLEKPSKPKENTDGFVTPLLHAKLHLQEEGPSEQTGHCGSDSQHSELIIKPIGAGSSSQLSEHLREDNEGQSQHEVRHEVLELPIAMFVNAKIHVSDQFSHQENKDDQELPLKLTEATPEDEAFLSGFQKRMREGLSELTSQQRSRQLNEQLENSQLQKRGRGRPPKLNKLTVQDAADSSDPSSLHIHEQEGATLTTIQSPQQKNKSLKQDGQVRTRSQIATMKDRAILLDSHLRQQEQVSETETSRHFQNKNKQQENVGLGTIGNSKEVSLETMEQQGPDLVSGLRSEQQNVQSKKDDRGRLRKQKEATKEDTTIRPQEGPMKKKKNKLADNHLEGPLNNPQSQHHNKKRKRGRPKIQKIEYKDDVDFMSSSRQSNCNLGSQNRQRNNSTKAESLGKGVTKGGAGPSNLQYPEQGNSKSASHVVLEASLTQSHVDPKESIPAATDHISCPDSALSAMGISDASTCLADQSSQQDNDQNQPRRRSTRNLESAKTILDYQNKKQPDLNLSDQRRLAKPTPALLSSDHHFVAKESPESENEVHGIPSEIKQTELPLDNMIPQQGCLPPSKPVTRLSNHQHDQGQRPESHDHDQACEKIENHLKLTKEITAKAAPRPPTHVPLSSKNLLRSRINRRSQDST